MESRIKLRSKFQKSVKYNVLDILALNELKVLKEVNIISDLK